MTLPNWVLAWLEAEGVAVEAFTTYVTEAAAKVDAPTTLVTGIVEWIKANVAGALNPDKVLIFAMGVVAELKSGKPGYNSDAGGVA